jgi:molecular chaperone GrpE
MTEEPKDKTTDELEPEKNLPEVSHVDHEHPEEEPQHKARKARKQIQRLEARVAELEEKLKAAEDKYVRFYAEMENTRKRMTRERIELLSMAGRDVMESLLPVLDDLERAEETIRQATDASGAIEGFELIRAKLTSLLEQRGLKAMASMGEVFDPELHEAVSEIEVEDESKKGKVVNEVVKGYRLNDRIIRHAKVVVGK